ncbi:hypothetical protein CBM2609_U10040 [Cupriavidus taiwanensis]|nr:hypothetical protein CBM2604_U10053 [Cupriavidus taiwanensis]SOZ34444.1 hypothetical protein CBM2609_U10040 [Cupriavidus taiwanensis]SOZ53043.1 hypothetical protein CBM2610_U10052 [Cupriavidus taiwanensis]
MRWMRRQPKRGGRNRFELPFRAVTLLARAGGDECVRFLGHVRLSWQRRYPDASIKGQWHDRRLPAHPKRTSGWSRD